MSREIKPTPMNCELIIRGFGIEDYEIGKNKVSKHVHFLLLF